MQEDTPTILIIEDQKFCTELFRAAFSEYTIITAPNGMDGIRACQEHRPHIVFLDIGLPDISGFRVLEKLRSMEPDAHIVMLSGMNNDAYVRKCRDLGAAGFLAKPYRKEFIEHYIRKFQST